MWMIFLAAPSAIAAPSACAPLDQPGFRSLLLDTQAAIDRADRASHRTFVEELDGRIPCLTFVPSRREWAEFLVASALLAFGDGGDWQAPLSAALQIRPGVDRGVGGAHPMSSFQAPPAEPGPPVPEGVALYVDGELADTLPPTTGMHLVQKEDDGYFASIVLRGSPVDEAWLAAPVKRPVTWSFGGRVGVGAGGMFVAQEPTSVLEPAYIPQEQRAEAVPVAVLAAGARRGRWGVEAEGLLQAPSFSRVSVARAELTATYGEDFRLGVGAGVAGGTVIEGVPGTGSEPEWAAREIALPYAAVSGSLTSGAWDARLGLGWGPAVARGALGLGRAVRVGTTPLRVGLDLDAQRGVFVQEEVPDRGATNWQGRGALSIAWLLGAG